jgi:hypothetical protein
MLLEWVYDHLAAGWQSKPTCTSTVYINWNLKRDSTSEREMSYHKWELNAGGALSNMGGSCGSQWMIAYFMTQPCLQCHLPHLIKNNNLLYIAGEDYDLLHAVAAFCNFCASLAVLHIKSWTLIKGNLNARPAPSCKQCKQCGANLQGVGPNPHTPYVHAKHEIDQS